MSPAPTVDQVENSAGRLHLRPWLPRDADQVHAACQDPEVQRWTTVPSPYTREDARVFVEEISPRLWADGTAATFAVLDATSGDVLASVGLHGISPRDRTAELGFWCAAPARGTGVVTQASAAVCRWGFGALGLQRVEWVAEVGNAGSRRVADKLGFRLEGVARARVRHEGQPRDAWVAGLLPGELP
jgi:RimJ/RimL family protein N-acetyltransferase